MKLLASCEYRFHRTPDAVVWTQTVFASTAWSIHLKVFDEVNVLARVEDVPHPPPNAVPASGERVKFIAIPYYVGPWNYLKRRASVRLAIIGAINNAEAVLLRIPSQIAGMAESCLLRDDHPFAVRVVGDPDESMAAGAMRHPLRPFLRWWFARRQRSQCWNSCAAAYVTDEILQAKYPSRPDAPRFSFSDVDLPDDAYTLSPRAHDRKRANWTLITVTSMEQPYKAVDVQIDAVARCVSRGLDLNFAIIGGGRQRESLEARGHQRGLGHRIRFLGQLPGGKAVREELDRADLFLMPSRTEGKPRALIEAMARALPSIGSHAGGIPELLPEEDLVQAGDVGSLSNKLIEVLESPGRMDAMSVRNLERSRAFSHGHVEGRMLEFYRHLETMTRAWMDRRSR